MALDTTRPAIWSADSSNRMVLSGNYNKAGYGFGGLYEIFSPQADSGVMDTLLWEYDALIKFPGFMRLRWTTPLIAGFTDTIKCDYVVILPHGD